MTAELIEGARVILDDRVEVASVRVEAGRITGIDVARDGATVIPAGGRLLAPAFVDVHGDAFERQLMPRPGVMIPLDTALLETDRQLAANGIATAYHALTLSWEPGLRSVETGWQVIRALDGCVRASPPRTACNCGGKPSVPRRTPDRPCAVRPRPPGFWPSTTIRPRCFCTPMWRFRIGPSTMSRTTP